MGSTTEMIFQVNTQCANSGYLTCCSLTPRQADIYGIFFAAQRCLRRFCMKAGNFLFTYVFFSTIFFSRNDVSGQRFREAEGEASPQSPPAGALLLKKGGKKRGKKKRGEKEKKRTVLPFRGCFGQALFSPVFDYGFQKRCKGVHCVDLEESFPTSTSSQNLASIQPRTSPIIS